MSLLIILFCDIMLRTHRTHVYVLKCGTDNSQQTPPPPHILPLLASQLAVIITEINRRHNTFHKQTSTM